MWLKSFMKVMLNSNNNSERALMEVYRKLAVIFERKVQAKLTEI